MAIQFAVSHPIGADRKPHLNRYGRIYHQWPGAGVDSTSDRVVFLDGAAPFTEAALAARAVTMYMVMYAATGSTAGRMWSWRGGDGGDINSQWLCGDAGAVSNFVGTNSVHAQKDTANGALVFGEPQITVYSFLGIGNSPNCRFYGTQSGIFDLITEYTDGALNDNGSGSALTGAAADFCQLFDITSLGLGWSDACFWLFAMYEENHTIGEMEQFRRAILHGEIPKIGRPICIMVPVGNTWVDLIDHATIARVNSASARGALVGAAPNAFALPTYNSQWFRRGVATAAAGGAVISPYYSSYYYRNIVMGLS